MKTVTISLQVLIALLLAGVIWVARDIRDRMPQHGEAVKISSDTLLPVSMAGTVPIPVHVTDSVPLTIDNPPTAPVRVTITKDFR